MTMSIIFERRLPDGSVGCLGTAYESPRGWRFVPAVASHKPSRKVHATMERCLPRWLHYPDGCESRSV